MMEKHPVYFAAANTTKGFKSYFPAIFDPDKLKRILIIKGGPGTGKSSLMRTVAAEAEQRGQTVERFACSSDPVSLDGVYLPEIGLGILDGTSPHTVDPIYPGAVDSIINTGAFWNVKKLLSHKGEILSVIRDGKRSYKRAYGFLSAVGEISSEIKRIAVRDLNEEKMQGLIQRLSKSVFIKGTEPEEHIRVLSSFNRDGCTHLAGFLPEAKRIWMIRDLHCTGTEFLEALAKAAREAKQRFVYCPSCLFPDQPDALYFPATGAAFMLENESLLSAATGKDLRVINMRRFLSQSTIRDNLQKLRFGKKCAETLIDGASEAFREASESHARLERYYIAAMDFLALDRFVKETTEKYLQI